MNQLHDMGQFSTLKDMESLVLTALDSLCQEAQDLSSTGRDRYGRGQGPSTPPWALDPNELVRAPELRDMVLEDPDVLHSPGSESSACMATLPAGPKATLLLQGEGLALGFSGAPGPLHCKPFLTGMEALDFFFVGG